MIFFVSIYLILALRKPNRRNCPMPKTAVNVTSNMAQGCEEIVCALIFALERFIKVSAIKKARNTKSTGQNFLPPIVPLRMNVEYFIF
jgi:hypothetical protein